MNIPFRLDRKRPSIRETFDREQYVREEILIPTVYQIVHTLHPTSSSKLAEIIVEWLSNTQLRAAKLIQTPNGGKPVVPPCDRDLWLQRIEEAKAKHAESLRQNNIVDVQITWSCEDPDSPVRVNVPEDEAKIVMDLWKRQYSMHLWEPVERRAGFNIILPEHEANDLAVRIPNWPLKIEDNITSDFRIKPRSRMPLKDPQLVKTMITLLKECRKRRLEARQTRRLGESLPPPDYRPWLPFPTYNPPRFQPRMPEIPKDVIRPVSISRIIGALPEEFRPMTQDEVDEFRMRNQDFFFTPMPERLVKKLRERSGEKEVSTKKISPKRVSPKKAFTRKVLKPRTTSSANATRKQISQITLLRQGVTQPKTTKKRRESSKVVLKPAKSSTHSVAVVSPSSRGRSTTLTDISYIACGFAKSQPPFSSVYSRRHA